MSQDWYLTSDVKTQEFVCMTYGIFYLGRGIATGKDKTEIARTLWQWNQWMMHVCGDLHTCNQRYSLSFFHAMNSFQHASSRNRNHHDTRGMCITLNAANLFADSM